MAQLKRNWNVSECETFFSQFELNELLLQLVAFKMYQRDGFLNEERFLKAIDAIIKFCTGRRVT